MRKLSAGLASFFNNLLYRSVCVWFPDRLLFLQRLLLSRRSESEDEDEDRACL